MDPRVHRLTDLLGAVVVDGTGRRIGRVADLTLRLGHGDATVDRLLVRRSGATTTLPWTAVRRVDVRRISVGTPGEPAVEALRRTDEPLRPDEALASDELLLGRDVLDTQIVDLDGRRLVRVADVLLAEGPDGSLVAVAAHIGFGAVLQRLGLRRLGRRLHDDAVAWDALHLTSARGHTVQLATPAAVVHHLTPDDLGVLLDAVTTQAGVEIVRAVHPDLATAALATSHPHTLRRLNRALHHPDSVPVRRTRRHDGWRRRISPHRMPR